MLKRKIDPYEAFAKSADLVYFGKIHAHDEIVPVRGYTFSPKRHDDHFMQGPREGHEISLLHRSTRLGMAHGQEYDWTIAHCRLFVSNLPHILLDAGAREDELDRLILSKFPILRAATVMMNNTAFQQRFRLYCEPDEVQDTQVLLPPTLLQLLADDYSRYCLEIEDNNLFVLRRGKVTTELEISQQVDAMLALAAELEQNALGS